MRTKCVGRVEGEECYYDACAGLHNSADAIVDVAAVQSQPEACHFTTKFMYFNLTDLNAVSKPALRFEPLTTPFLEIKTVKTFKPIAQVRKATQEQAAIAKSIATGAVSAVAEFNSISLYDVATEFSYFIREPEKLIPLGTLDDTSRWMQNVCDGLSADTIRLCQSIASASSTAGTLAVQEDETAIELTSLPLSQVEPRSLPSHPSEWKCEECGKMKNLWLNLSDGFVGCGRRQYGVEDSGCHGGLEGAAIRHYEKHPEFHVAVKLGTISPVTADLFSYKWDSTVHDPQLDGHLRRLGLDRAQLTQTSQSTADLAVEQNQRLMCGLPDSRDARARRVYGQGHVGITNIGNSCYISSVIQLLRVVFDRSPINLPCQESEDYLDGLQKCFDAGVFNKSSGDLKSDLIFQVYRLMHPLSRRIEEQRYRDVYSARRSLIVSGFDCAEMASIIPVDDPTFSPGVPRPYFLKRLIGTMNREFATTFQQDAEEFFQFLFTRFVEAEMQRFKQSRLQQSLELLTMTKTTMGGNEYKMSKSRAPILRLRLPARIIGGEPRGVLLLENLIRFWSKVHDGELGDKAAVRGLLSFPEFIMIQIQRLTVDSSYAAVKLTDDVSVPSMMDLTFCRAPTIGSGEKASDDDEPVLNNRVVEELKVFGFTHAQMQAAAKLLPTHSHTTEALMDCILNSNSQDADMSAPDVVNAETISMLMALGFDSDIAQAALQKADGDLEAAANILLTDPQSCFQPSPPQETPAQTRNTKYKLKGVIIHIGANAHCGHYVAYVLKNNLWCLYNDDIVTSCDGVPDFRAAYLCLYERFDE